MKENYYLFQLQPLCRWKRGQFPYTAWVISDSIAGFQEPTGNAQRRTPFSRRRFKNKWGYYWRDCVTFRDVFTKFWWFFDCCHCPLCHQGKGILRFYSSLGRKSVPSIHFCYTNTEKEKLLDALEMRSFSDSLINNKRMPKLSHWSRRMCISSV